MMVMACFFMQKTKNLHKGRLLGVFDIINACLAIQQTLI